MQAVTYIDQHKSLRVFRLKLIETFGCSRELECRLIYAKGITERLLAKLEGRSLPDPGTAVTLATVEARTTHIN